MTLEQTTTDRCENCGRSLTAEEHAFGVRLCPQCAEIRAEQPASSEGSTTPGPPAYASWGTRFIAYLLDYFIGGVLALAVGFVAALVAVLIADLLGQSEDAANTLFTAVFISVDAAAAIGYLTLDAAHGRAIGKRMLGVGIVDARTGERIGLRRGLLRTIVKGLGVVTLYLSWLWMVWDDRKQSWHDKAAGSVVVWHPSFSNEGRSRFANPLPQVVAVVACLLIAAVVAGVATGIATEPKDSSAAPVVRLAAGDCIAFDADALYRIVDCADSNYDALVLAVFDMPGGSAYPGEDEVFAYADENCPFETETYSYPLASSWKLGDKQIACVVEAP